MVEDWLNPDNSGAAGSSKQDTDNKIAPQVQDKQNTGQCPCPGTSAQQKISKVKPIFSRMAMLRYSQCSSSSDCRRSVPAYWTWLPRLHSSQPTVPGSCCSWTTTVSQLQSASSAVTSWQEEVSRYSWQCSCGSIHHQDNKMQETQGWPSKLIRGRLRKPIQDEIIYSKLHHYLIVSFISFYNKILMFLDFSHIYCSQTRLFLTQKFSRTD